MKHRTLTCVAALELAMLCIAGSAAAQPVATPGSQLDEIVVTAQRRSQRLIDVPASISVQTGEQLAASGVTNTREFTQLVPGLQFIVNGAFASPALRGISAQGASPGSENAVGIYIDGLYLSNQVASTMDLPDIQQVEVLKGPQGTLYGRNATAGVILITTRAPSKTPQGHLTLSYGSFKDTEAKGYISGPINDVLSVSLAAAYRDLDGWTYNTFTKDRVGAINSKIVRGKVRFEPNDVANFTLTGIYARRYDESGFAQTVLGGNTVTRANFPNTIIPTEPYTTAADFPSYQISRMKGGALRSVVNLSPGVLTAVNGYTVVDNHISVDSDSTPAFGGATVIDASEHAWSHDVSFASNPMGPVTFLVGGTYFKGKAWNHPFISVNANESWGMVRTEAYAAFGSATYQVTDELSLQAGLRYSHEKRSLAGSKVAPVYPLINTTSFKNTSPSLIVKYSVPEVGNLYGSYVKGFKSGEYSVSGLTPTPTRPEHITAYEIGFKSRRMGDFSFDVAAFYYDYKDIIVSVAQLPNPAITKNAAKARSKGIDFNAQWTPTENFTLHGGVAYLEAKYTDFPSGFANIPKWPAGTPGVTAAQSCPAGRFPCGNFAFTFPNLAGKYLPRAPKVSATLAADYKMDVGSGQAIFNLNAYYSAKFFFETFNRVTQRPYALFNGKIGFKPSRDRDLIVSVWGRNLLDKVYIQGSNPTSAADNVAYGPPRAYGVSIEAGF